MRKKEVHRKPKKKKKGEMAPATLLLQSKSFFENGRKKKKKKAADLADTLHPCLDCDTHLDGPQDRSFWLVPFIYAYDT